jgi:hypothetical protein
MLNVEQNYPATGKWNADTTHFSEKVGSDFSATINLKGRPTVVFV